MKRILKWVIAAVLLCTIFVGCLLFLSFITSTVDFINWGNAFDGMSALGTVLIPLAVVYIETKVEHTRTRIESENAEAIEEMKAILEENQKVLRSVKEFEDTYGEDVKAFARIRRSSNTLLTGEMHGGDLNLYTVSTK